ncbi:MAG: MiaB/RimO family radical SAM methylthiotransferase [Spirochaetaceae bacterium]|nr:MiaB/RimO family radical SAM methylthiotransferase [Spirochaetaceae bacterium]
MLSIAFQTLGCKLNQCETDSMAAAFANAGFPIATCAEQAELLVVNTCAVTSKAEQKGRRAIRAVLACNPRCAVLVTGCQASADRSGLEALEGRRGETGRRVFVVPQDGKGRIAELPHALLREGVYDQAALRRALEHFCGARGDDARGFWFDAGNAGLRSRYFLKIQDGCDNSCAYCLVSVVRGPARSLPVPEALERLRAAESSGLAEAVLTGVNIGQWNEPPAGVSSGGGLPSLLRSLLAGTNRIGIRLSSLEPDVFTEDFFDAVKNPRVRPHFHLSIQSGSHRILKRMGRQYEPEAVLRAVSRLRSLKTDPFIACDMITGFPGETERDFLETLKFCQTAEFAQIHAFPFSRRRGTAAWDLTPRIPERLSGERVKILKNLALSCRKKYIGLWIGREVGGVCLSGCAMTAQTGMLEILSDNYLRLIGEIPRDSKVFVQKGQPLRCKIREIPPESAWSANNARFDAGCEILWG